MELPKGGRVHQEIGEASCLLTPESEFTNPRFYEEVRMRTVQASSPHSSPKFPCWAAGTLVTSMAAIGPLLLWEGKVSDSHRTTFAGYFLSLTISFPLVVISLMVGACSLYAKITKPSIEEMK